MKISTKHGIFKVKSKFHLTYFRVKIIKFKTNINCEGCLATVTPFLNDADFISNWQVDTSDADKVLTVSGEGIEPQQVINLVQEAGFKADVVRVQGIGGGDL